LPLPPLRKWQTDALSAWEKNHLHGTFEVATGGGKTTFALAAFSRAEASGHIARVLVIVPTLALLDQWVISAKDDLNLADEHIKILSAADLRPSARFNIVVINTARRFNGEVPDRHDLLLVVDECHRAGSVENSKALVKDCRATMGLSATPYREFDDGFEEFVQPVLGPILVRYTLDDAIADKVLSPLHVQYVKVPMLEDEQDEYDRLSRRIAAAMNGGDDEALEQLLRRRARVYNGAYWRLPVAAALVDAHRGARTLVFVESIADAKKTTEELDRRGHSVTLYHSKMGTHHRQSNLRAFRKGVFDVLVACRALDEGFNVPEAQFALIASGTSSRRQRIQRMGRVLRTIHGKDLANVVTLYASATEEVRFLKEAEAFGKDVEISWGEARV
jgi:superfamily II DNA or RNA helicase